MSDCDRILDVDALIDGEAGDGVAEIERHIRDCTPCRMYWEAARHNDALLRRGAADIVPDPSLERRLFGPEQKQHSARPRASRRGILAGMSAAACLGGLGLMLRPSPGNAAEFRDAVLGDFATNIAADRPLDIVDSDPGHVMPWISARVPFVLPNRIAPEGAQLVGCRLCWLVGRRLAAFSIDVDETRVGVYIAGSEGLTDLPGEGKPCAMAARDGLQGAFWRDHGLALALVGPIPAARLTGLADTLRL